MGRTVPTYHDALTELLARWEREFGRALTRPEDRAAFAALVRAAREYIPQGTLMTSGDLVERVLLSLLVRLYRAPSPGPPAAEPDGPLERAAGGR